MGKEIIRLENIRRNFIVGNETAVSYTHLDVYKRQVGKNINSWEYVLSSYYLQ